MEEKKYTILVVDDDPTIVEMIQDGLMTENFDVITAIRPQDVWKKVEHVVLDYALLDLDLGWGNLTGIELGEELVKKYPELIVIIMTGYHNLKFAVQAMRENGFHYMIKPFRIDQIVSLTERAQRELQLKRENRFLKEEIDHLKKEITELTELIRQIRPEEAGLSYSTKEKNLNKRIGNANALNSYKRQKDSSFGAPDKKE